MKNTILDFLVTYDLNVQDGYMLLKLWVICIICLGLSDVFFPSVFGINREKRFSLEKQMSFVWKVSSLLEHCNPCSNL